MKNARKWKEIASSLPAPSILCHNSGRFTPTLAVGGDSKMEG
jgi:hypothetical protein